MSTIAKNKRRTASTVKSNNRRTSVSATSKNLNRRPVASTKATSRRSNSVISLENGINVIKLALRKKLSVSAAAKASGFGRNYISDIKSRLKENYKSKNITKELYNSFVTLNKEYNKVAR